VLLATSARRSASSLSPCHPIDSAANKSSSINRFSDSARKKTEHKTGAVLKNIFKKEHPPHTIDSTTSNPLQPLTGSGTVVIFS
jgi:hypothetical protein